MAMVKDTTNLLQTTVKAALIGAVGRGVGKAVAGNLGEALGGVAAGAFIKGPAGQTVALISVMDAVHNMVGAGGAAEARDAAPQRREV